MATATLSRKRILKERNEWTALVSELVDQVESWAKESNWGVHRESKPIRETPFGTYRVPVLSILAPSGRFQLDPVGRFIAAGDGRVDLIAWPSFHRMMIIRAGDQWKIKTDSGASWPRKWNQRTFAELLETLSLA